MIAYQWILEYCWNKYIFWPVCRVLGLPARSVTNFASAHDCDGSITIDNYWDTAGNPLTEYNEDSVWYVKLNKVYVHVGPC